MYGSSTSGHIKGKLLKTPTAFFIFSFSILSLSWYLINSRLQIYLPLPIFWGSAICVLLLIAYQIIKLDESSSQHFLILLQIMMFTSITRTIFVPDVAFYGYDPYHEVAATVVISRNGWEPSATYPIFASGYGYPLIHFLAIIYSQTNGIELFTTAKWLPIVFSIPVTLILYQLSIKLVNSRRVGLLTALAFSTLYQSQMFHSLFLRESIAFVMFVTTIYVYYMAIYTRKKTYLYLAFVSSIASVFSHHLTPFLLMVFFLSTYILQKLTTRTQIGKNKLSKELYRIFPVRSRAFSLIFILFFIVFLFSYWTHLHYSPLEIIATILREAYFVIGGQPAGIPLLRYWIMLWAEIAFAFIFGLLSVYGFCLRDNERTSLDVTSIAWAFLMGLFAVGFSMGRILPEGSFAMARRFQAFSYPFLFMLSGYVAHKKFKKPKRPEMLGIIVISIFIGFSILQLYSIPPYLYSDYEISYNQGEYRNILLPQEYRATIWSTPQGKVVIDWNVMAHVMRSARVLTPSLEVEAYDRENAKTQGYTYFIARRVGPFLLTDAELHFLTECNNEVYNNGVVEIYRRR